MNVPEYPYDPVEWLAYSDWLEENGKDLEASHWRDTVRALPRIKRHGYGDGYGYGYGDEPINPILETNKPMKVGSKVLVWCGNGFAWCGMVQERTGPYEYMLADASMICRTGGTPWLELAHGKGRDQTTFQKAHKPVGIGPQIHGWTEWEGDLP